MISKPSLDTKNTGGAVGQPQYAGDTTIISTKSADMSGGESSMMSYSHTNESAKWKNGAQDVPAKGKDQYSHHG